MHDDLKKAFLFYRQFNQVTVVILILTSLMIYLFKDFIASCFTKDENVVNIVTSIIWLISFNTFPDGYKGMLKGMIKALEL